MKLKLVLFLLITPLMLFGQGEANNWFFGNGAGLNFNTTTPTPISGSLYTNEGCASFSDANGGLLFYTSGTTVWDKTGAIMPNGTNLKGDPSSSQSAIIVPHPGNPDLFYIFTVGSNNYNTNGDLIKATEGLNCYTVNMSLRGGLGDIVGSPTDLSYGLNADWTEKVTSVKGVDCNTFWVISFVNNKFLSYKIDINGLNSTQISSPVNYYSVDDRGNCCTTSIF